MISVHLKVKNLIKKINTIFSIQYFLILEFCVSSMCYFSKFCIQNNFNGAATVHIGTLKNSTIVFTLMVTRHYN